MPGEDVCVVAKASKEGSMSTAHLLVGGIGSLLAGFAVTLVVVKCSIWVVSDIRADLSRVRELHARLAKGGR